METELFPQHQVALRPGEQHDDLGIVPGHQGDAFTVLKRLFRENTRTAGDKAGRTIVTMLSAVTILPGMYLLGKLVTVPSGSIGIGLSKGVVQLYGPGQHCLMSASNRVADFATYDLTREVINRNQFWIITVKRDEFGLATDRGEPLILGPGIHVIDNPFFLFVRKVLQSTPVIAHLGLHRILVPQGTRGLAVDGDTPVLLNPGEYTRNSPSFEFRRLARVDEQVVQLPPFTLITVYTAQTGIVYRKGQLHALQPGSYVLFAERGEEFGGLVATSEQVRQLQPLDILTSDGLMVRVHGSVSFRIVDAEKAVRAIGTSTETRLMPAPAPTPVDPEAGMVPPAQKEEQEPQEESSSSKLLTIGQTLAEAVAPVAEAAKPMVEQSTPVGLWGAYRRDRRDRKEEERRRDAEYEEPVHFGRDGPGLAEQEDVAEEEQARTAAQEEADAQKDASAGTSDLQDALFKTILTRCNNTLAALLNGTDLLSTGGPGFAASSLALEQATGPGKSEYSSSRRDLAGAVNTQFMRTLAQHLRSEWGVELTDLSVTEIAVMDADVRRSLADGVRTSLDANNARRNAEAAAETTRIAAAANAEASRLATDASAYDIRQIAMAQRDMGTYLEASPLAATVRLAESSAAAVGKSGLVVLPDASSHALLKVLGVQQGNPGAIGNLQVAAVPAAEPPRDRTTYSQ